MSDEPYVPPKVTYNEDDSDDDMDIQIIEPIPIEDLNEDQLQGLRVLAQKVLGYYEERDAEEKPSAEAEKDKNE